MPRDNVGRRDKATGVVIVAALIRPMSVGNRIK